MKCHGRLQLELLRNITYDILNSATDTGKKDVPEGVEFELSSVVIVAGIIGATVVLAVAVIVCGVVYIQKYRWMKYY